MRRLRTAPAGAAKFFLVPEGRGELHSPPIRSRKGPNVCTRAAESFYFRRRSLSEQGSLASIYSISAPSMLAWPRYTVYRPQTCLHGLDIQYIGPKHAYMASIYSISAPNMLAWPRYTVYRPQTCLHGLDIQYIGSKHACMASIYSISALSMLHGFDIHSNIGYTSLNDYDFINTERNETHKNH